MQNNKLYFAGTPPFARHCLAALLEHYEILGVFTQPDRPAGRGKQLQPSPVKQLALERGLPVLQPEKLNDPTLLNQLERPAAIIVVAYGLLLPQWFLDFPEHGCLNLHASLLPRWRGAAPIQRAIEAGDLETGVAVMQMDAGLDTGPVWLEKRLTIGDDNGQRLHDRLMGLGAEALLEALPLVLSGQVQPRPQPEAGTCYARKLTVAEAQLDWQRSAEELARQVRAFNPQPGARALLDGEMVKIHTAEALPGMYKPGLIVKHDRDGICVGTGAGLLRLQLLQLAGKRPATAADLLNGRQDLTGRSFSHE